MDLHDAADLVRALERLHEEIVGHHQGALVGEEDLEGRDALVDHCLHVLEGLRVRSGDRHVKAIVDVCGTLGATHPLIERRLQTVGLHLQTEVDDCRHATSCSSLRAGVVVVGAGRATKRHRHVGVVVDQARQHVAARRVDHLGVDVVERADRGDRLAVDQDIRLRCIGCGDDGAATDDLEHLIPLTRET